MGRFLCMEKIKWNTGTAIDITGATALLLFCVWLYNGNKKVAIGLAVCVILCIVFFLLYALKADTKLTNESDTSVFTKPEEGEEPNEVKPNEMLYGLDGVKSKGRVYKLVDGTHATVTETGKVKIHSIFGKLVNSIRGGELTSPPDNGWQKLFEK